MAFTTIDNPEQYFNCVQYTGNSTEPRNIDVGFQADITWTKDCTVAYYHRLFDSNRGGAPIYPSSNITQDSANDGPELDYSSPYTNGFKIIDNPDGTTNSYGVNQNSSLYTSWNWKCNGGTTSSNTDGDLTSTVQVNADAGLSICTWTAPNTTARNIGHGLGVEPDYIMIRNLNRVEDFRNYWKIKGHGGTAYNTEYPYNTTSTSLITGATSSTFGVGTDFSVNGGFNYVAYCYKAIQGYSKFGDYYGNGGTDSGTVVYTGFKPALVIIKSTATGVSWMMHDNVRDSKNPVASRIKVNTNDVPATNISMMDFLSNGFQLKYNDSSWNSNGQQYLYMAFAEHPFVSSTGAPTTAR